MTWLLQILPIFIFTLIGFGVLLLLQVPFKRLPIAGTVALAFWCGALMITFVIMLAGVITGKILLFLVWPLLLGAISVIAYHRHELKPDSPIIFSRTELIQMMLSIPLMGLILFNIYRGIELNFFYEIVAFDAVGNFAMKAKLWYYTRDLFPPLLEDAEYLMFKRRYPPMVIMSETTWAYLMGRWDGIGLKYFFLMCWFSSGLLIYALVKSRVNIFSAWLATAVWYALPINIGFVWIGVLTGYGDVPLAVAFLSASLALGLWGKTPKDRSQWGAAILTGLMLSSAFWTKKEGLPFIGAAAIYIIFSRLPWRQTLAVGGICIGFIIVYMASVRNLPSHFEKDISLDIPQYAIVYRLGLFWELLKNEMNKIDDWGEKLWMAMILVWVFKLISLRWRGWLTRELYFVLSMGFFYMIVCLLTIFEFKQNFRFLFPRLMLQLYPLLIVATFVGFSPTQSIENLPETNVAEPKIESIPASQTP